ncbi:hypothetical protein [Nonomuraea endophytica]|uniref:Ni2+-binding GTPase involved in maturation of urease and hydrogenase n=1 Tax=Nonomuraea endophytica TaxID=714136 RepID=A0A7W8EH06_9ACTN|nr:hypothetical protein [Nonomuraea endophytica]MBB5079043.1 Ni2+-binding GTPase involved in maturation of urease and hydrogenase [Nonomuraea endophytica]
MPYLDFPLATFQTHLSRVNAHAPVLPLSATRGDGTSAWYDWLRAL